MSESTGGSLPSVGETASTSPMAPNTALHSRFDDLRHVDSNGATSLTGGAAGQVVREDSSVVRVDEQHRLGHMLSILTLTRLVKPDVDGGDGNGQAVRSANPGTISVELAAYLAIHHFNNRNGTVVPGLEEKLKDCDLYFTVDIADSEGTPITGARAFLDAVGSFRPSISEPKPTGVVGLGLSTVTMPVSILGGVAEVPQVSCCATSSDLGSEDSHLFSRVTTTNTAEARAAAFFLHDLGVTHVGVLHVQGTYGQGYARDFGAEAARMNIRVVYAQFDPSDEDSRTSALQRLADTNYKYIFGIFQQSIMLETMAAANRAGITGDGYAWFLGEGGSSLVRASLFVDPSEQDTIDAIQRIGVIVRNIPPNPKLDQAVSDFQIDGALQQHFASRHVSKEQTNRKNTKPIERHPSPNRYRTDNKKSDTNASNLLCIYKLCLVLTNCCLLYYCRSTTNSWMGLTTTKSPHHTLRN